MVNQTGSEGVSERPGLYGIGTRMGGSGVEHRHFTSVPGPFDEDRVFLVLRERDDLR